MVDEAGSAARSSIDITRLELDRAREQLRVVQAEYESLLADPDAIQEDRDAAAQLAESMRGRVARAEKAAARAESGDYGRCVRCGAEIPAERLEALPDTDTCVNCG